MFNVIMQVVMNICFFIILSHDLKLFSAQKNKGDKKGIKILLLILMIMAVVSYIVYIVYQIKAFLANGILSENKSELSLSIALMVIANALLVENNKEKVK